MATTPTQLPIPSEKPQDLKFNAGKIDEFVTSMGWTYSDRFGVKHYTIEGLRYIAQQAISAFGYITIDSFEDGATLTLPNQILRWKSNGEYYRWDGAFPKVVASGSTPESAGGIGRGFWLSVGDASLRQSLEITENEANLFTYSFPYLPYKANINISDSDPDFKASGSGKIISNAININFTPLSYNPSKENVVYAPGTYLRAKTGEPYPTRENPLHLGQCYRFVLSQGSNLDDDTKSIHHVVAVGNTIGCSPLDWQLVDAFGGNALMYAGRVSRTTAIGSESMAWFGAPDQQWMIDKCHDFWRKPDSNPYLPGEPGWNAADLETNFPGIGARLAAFTAYATTSDQAGYSAGLGRDALNHIVVGVRNTAAGYASAQHMFNGSYNTAIGALALNSCVFGEANTAVGDQAGRLANDSLNCTFLGYGAGRSIRGATGSVFIGDRTADNVLSGTKAVIIGAQAGQDHPTTLDNKLIISTSTSLGTQPLISGDFSKTFAGSNISPDKVRAHWHVRDSDSGSTLTPTAGLLVESGAVSSITVESRNTGFCSLRFADPEAVNSGYIEYSHSSDSMTLGTGTSARWRIENTGALIPMVDNAYTFGRTAFRPSVIYAGTGTINTSDETLKTRLEIDLAEKEAALEIKKDIWKFKFKDADESKSGNGRIHFGVGAQSVGEILRKHGLDPESYAFFCYDEWDDEFEQVFAKRKVTKQRNNSIVNSVTGESSGEFIESYEVEEEYDTGEKRLTLAAGSRYGIRYEELLCFIIAAM